ncbi:DNA-3-methyladenine glycosylase [Bradyrhizobium sp. 168]|uniref:DNA-3-methyladenine glycosylase n=1 Tax=Bradyrhizobium sp. 168 TaxID=2782639 RepID=UPI001FF9E5DC|nr:DNA-3-methyladenine glycosylase [Bradyrhizobium sp. 168]MCK1580680.1 DNA-3-methyladenine glycosylase [Bradyrhizobium sp. 168]
MAGFDCHSFESLQPLPKEFFKSDVETVARALIGAFLFNVDEHGTPVGGRIVETEAYGHGDPAAHCSGDKRPAGERAPRKFFDSMYLSGGHIYVYKDGPEYCYLNFTCGQANYCSAVLIRAIEPCKNSVDAMKNRRLKFVNRLSDKELDQKLCSGPIRLSQALGIEPSMDGAHISETSLRLFSRTERPEILCGPRVNVTQGADLMRRYVIRGSPFISELANERYPLFDDETSVSQPG